jgi:hypothetical protein
MPDATSAEDAVGATILDDRYFAAMKGLRGRIARCVPYLSLRVAVVVLHGKEYDAVLSWSDLPAIVIAALMRLQRRRPAHIAILC